MAESNDQINAADPTSPPDVRLTELEKALLELNQQKLRNLELNHQIVQGQFAQQRGQLSREGLALVQKFAAARGLDLRRWQILPGSDRFSAVPEPPKLDGKPS